jgi:Rho GDP-dissociation inhibitor
MAEQEKHEHDDEPEETPGYQPPAPKSMEEILKSDAEDESLRKYKESLLGSATPGLEIFPNDPRRVIVTKLALVVPDRTDVELDLTGNLEELKQKSFIIKEGCMYQLKIYFYVQHEIVTGLKYIQTSYRAGVRVDKSNFMVGSYGPKAEIQSYTTPKEEAPSGMLARGTYTVKSLFTDDDKFEHLSWEWKLEIKKDWE